MRPESRPFLISDIEARLRNELESAQAAYHEAKVRSAEANRIIEDLGLNHPDGHAVLRNTMRSESQALRRYAEAMKAFNNFVLHRRLPKKLPG
jgi:hypothetical protein